MYSGWRLELWCVAGLCFLAFLAGLILGYPYLFLLLAGVAYLIWHALNVVRLQRWLRQGSKRQPPIAHGVWGDIFNDLFRLQARNRKRKRKIARALSQFREAISALPDATIALNTDNEIEWCNEAAKQQFGLRWPHDAGQCIVNLVRNPA